MGELVEPNSAYHGGLVHRIQLIQQPCTKAAWSIGLLRRLLRRKPAAYRRYAQADGWDEQHNNNANRTRYATLTRTHPKTASACAAAAARCCGAAHATNAAITAVTAHPVAVMSVSMGTPLLTRSTICPSVTYRKKHPPPTSTRGLGEIRRMTA